ncbi:MAG: polysaccharide deacetylase family protein [Massilia sp.]
MPAIERKSLCVSIHDVAPATWPDCLALLRAVRAVADIPLTWLVVPCFHDVPSGSLAMDESLLAMQAGGHELALHGYTHLDTASAPDRQFLRTVYTQGEGEFSSLTEAESRQRIALGLQWFDERGFQALGFVAPAWLMNEASWRAVREGPFLYTTTLTHFHVLPVHRAVCSPSLVYTARNAAGRLLSPPLAGVMAAALRPNALVRLSLHPRDAHHPALLRHAQQLIERLLHARTPLTKAAFAQRVMVHQYGPHRPPPPQCERP